MDLKGRNEVENWNGGCVIKVASVGSRAQMRTKEWGNKEKSLSVSGRFAWFFFQRLFAGVLQRIFMYYWTGTRLARLLV